MKHPFLTLAAVCLVVGVTAAAKVENLTYAIVLIGSGLVFMTIGLFQFQSRQRKGGPS